MNRSIEIVWGVNFVTRSAVAGLPSLLRISEERQAGSGYRFSGRGRSESHVVFQYTLGGVGRLIDKRGEHMLPRGTGFLCAVDDPEVSYEWPAKSTEPWHFVFAAFSGTRVRDLVASYVAARGRMVQIDPDHRVVRGLCGWSRHNTESVLVDSTAALRLFADILDACEHGAKASPSSQLCAAAVALMQAHIAVPLSIERIAGDLSVSREYLTRVFRRELATTPGQLYLRLRLRRACESLMMSDATLSEIGVAHGFADATHFGKVFRRHMGMTPTEWRRMRIAG